MKPADRIKQEIKRWEAKMFPSLKIEKLPPLKPICTPTPTNSPVMTGRKL